jgi:hypothetical protein
VSPGAPRQPGAARLSHLYALPYLTDHSRHRRGALARAGAGYIAGGLELGGHIAQRARAPGKGIARKFLGECDCLRRRLGYLQYIELKLSDAAIQRHCLANPRRKSQFA